MPKITVIVPVYKVEPYLRRCVDSILNQTFTDFELILVDDGSPDGCGAICDEYIDPRITVIHQPNGGLSAARNSGIDWAFACSDSEWLGFVDSDDWVHPQYLEVLINTAINTSTNLCSCKFEEVTVNEIDSLVDQINMKTEVSTPERYWLDYYVDATVAWAKIYRKELFASFRYPVGKIHEDEFLTYQLLFGEKIISVIKQKLYYYYQNKDGITKSKWRIASLDKLEAFRGQYVFFVNHGFFKAARVALIHYKDCYIIERNNVDENLFGKKEYSRIKSKIMLENMKFVLSNFHTFWNTDNRAFLLWSFPLMYKTYCFVKSRHIESNKYNDV